MFRFGANGRRSREDRVRAAAKPRKRAAKQVVSLSDSSRLWGLLSRLPGYLSALNLLKNRQATQAIRKPVIAHPVDQVLFFLVFVVCFE